MYLEYNNFDRIVWGKHTVEYISCMYVPTICSDIYDRVGWDNSNKLTITHSQVDTQSTTILHEYTMKYYVGTYKFVIRSGGANPSNQWLTGHRGFSMTLI